MPEPIDLSPKDKAVVLAILERYVPEYEVWVFGSRVGTAPKMYSDLDLAVLTEKPLSLERLADLKEAFTESNLPFRVDVVDWASTGQGFQKIIEAKHEVLRTVAKGSA